MSEGTVAVSRRLLERVVDWLWTIQDQGPVGGGWKSDELMADILAIEELISHPEDVNPECPDRN